MNGVVVDKVVWDLHKAFINDEAIVWLVAYDKDKNEVIPIFEDRWSLEVSNILGEPASGKAEPANKPSKPTTIPVLDGQTANQFSNSTPLSPPQFSGPLVEVQ